MQPPLHLLIKPASGNCNLRCKYCFYADITEKREIPSFGMMTEETLETVVKKALLSGAPEVTFAFQGGEPTLVGLPFYRRLMQLQAQYNEKHIPIHNAIQTNGILMDDEWAAFFAENRFLVGLSMDGTEAANDLHRVDAKGDGTHKRLMQVVRLFKKHKVEFNILLGLCVGHDTLAIKYMDAPCTVLAVKDRVTGHNPIQAIYMANGYYKKRFYGDK